MDNESATSDRGDLTAEFVSRRVIDSDGVRVRRLLVAADETQLPVLVAPAAGAPLGLRTGDRYRFTDVVRCPLAADPLDAECPACGGTLRQRTALDAVPVLRTAADQLDAEEAVIVTEQSDIATAEPGDNPGWTTSLDEPQATPAAVCTACGETAEFPTVEVRD